MNRDYKHYATQRPNLAERFTESSAFIFILALLLAVLLVTGPEPVGSQLAVIDPPAVHECELPASQRDLSLDITHRVSQPVEL